MNIEILKSGARSYGCGNFLVNCKGIDLQDIYNSLEHERLTRKQAEVRATFDGLGGMNWGQTIYIHLMRTLGDEANKDAFVEVASRLSLAVLQRERLSQRGVEALLLGASGLLKTYHNDNYVVPLLRESEYLMHKYQITPISAKCWNIADVRPLNHPIFRLSQVASIINNEEFVMSSIIKCRTRQEVDDIFRVDATPHLLETHSLNSAELKKISIGSIKRNLLGINLVVPAKLAYGYYIHDDDMCAEAFELNEKLDAEHNKYTRGWGQKGLIPTSAYESQALIQLAKEYCQKLRCEECIVARFILHQSRKRASLGLL